MLRDHPGGLRCDSEEGRASALPPLEYSRLESHTRSSTAAPGTVIAKECVRGRGLTKERPAQHGTTRRRPRSRSIGLRALRVHRDRRQPGRPTAPRFVPAAASLRLQLDPGPPCSPRAAPAQIQRVHSKSAIFCWFLSKWRFSVGLCHCQASGAKQPGRSAGGRRQDTCAN